MTSGWVKYRGENRSIVVPGSPGGCAFTEERGVCLDAGGQDLAGRHMMTVIGYDRNFPSQEMYPVASESERGSFLVANQWGTKWGDLGYMWIPRRELQKIWIGGYGLLRDETGTIKLPDRPCVQDDTGRFIYGDSADGNDVAVNLACADENVPPEACDGPLTVRLTADRLTFPSNRISKVDGEDLADWYYFDIETDHTPVAISLTIPDTPFTVVTGSQASGGGSSNSLPSTTGPLPAGRVLEWRLLDTGYRSLGRKDPLTGTIATTLCAGRYYVVVRPNEAGLYDSIINPEDPVVDYTLEVQPGVGTPSPGSATCENEPTEPTPAPPCVNRAGQLGAAPASGSSQLFKALVRNGTQLNVELAGLSPGSRVQLVGALVGGGTSPQGIRGSNAHLYWAKSIVVDGAGRGSITLAPPESVHWSVYNPSEHWAEALVAVRRLDGGPPTDFSLCFQYVGESAETDVEVRVTDATTAELEGQWIFGAQDLKLPTADDAFTIVPHRECCRSNKIVLEIDHGCDSAQVVVLDGENGLPLARGTTTILSRFPGRTVVLVDDLPQDRHGDIMVSLRDEAGRALTSFAMCHRLQWSLESWPYVEFPSALDPDGRPTTPATLALGDGERQDSVGTTWPDGPWSSTDLPRSDYYDFYRVPNPTEHDKQVRLRVTGYPTDAAIVLSTWDQEGVRHAQAASQYVGFIPADPSTLELTITAPAGGEVIVMIEGFGNFTEYTIRADETAPLGNGQR
jgi:hypothetical protein